jgi:repressor LexA
MQPRTKRQREILDYLTGFIETHGYEPSYQQIARRFRIASKSAIANHIAALERQGFILRHREKGSFNLQIRSQKSVAEAVCVIDWIDIPRRENLEEWEQSPLFVSRFLLGFLDPEKVRAFRVQNDSMIDDHICEGDIALIEERSFARDGDCVLSVVEEELVALKRFYRDGPAIELRPSNKDHAAQRFPADKVLIKGVYRALLRPLE